MKNNNSEAQPQKSSTAGLALLALGIVYGDIGTSPLYAVKETFGPSHGIALETANILGGLSTIFWSLMIVVTFKYVMLIMRANNKGEGGIMALLALASSAVKDQPRWRKSILALGVVGASLFYGDAVLTPAISVLSAVEGLEVGTAAFKHYVIPIAVIVLVTLFMFQRHGTAVVGAFFGPICVLWFLALGAVGIHHIVQNPVVLQAVDPLHALRFATGHGFASFVVLGAVLLAFTGAEALYADMGHFGKRAVRLAWFGLVLPALVLNYFGQGALLIANPQAIDNPFYLAYPGWALYLMIALATAATVIASQATISGAYSITRQAIQLGYLPRMNIQHTSAKEIGQIYLPAVNWILLAAVLAAVTGFGSSSRLASAYGVSVMGTMLITTLLTFFVIRFGWGFSLLLAGIATGFFFLVDLAFFSASLLKVLDGGWFPLVMGAAVFTLMVTWRRGREILLTRLRQTSVPLDTFLDSLMRHPPVRVPGTAVFLTSTQGAVPHALLHNLAHNKVLHERVIFLTVVIKDVPWVPAKERIHIKDLGNNCFQLTVDFGFKDRPDVMQALELCREHELEFQPLQTSFFLSRETVIPSIHYEGMALWRERLFSMLARNASSPVEYFNLPANRVIELGTQIEI
ncbi:potassium transporter Kup [Sulfuricaulis limicola]|uniref:Probable potassium transport system protein Kup n=1 Tax=Sulfuricaulis limicola TaxID=1620215 RepID=A0A1B4XCK1_9GAMM|nr:potassium transporter Kup [Sulfuricaulis limicola]BAV32538.1 potassium transporter Kup [Sulfuricaulis limicola]